MIEPVHGNDGSLVGIKVDETVSGGLTGELVRHHLDADHPRLSHHVHGILEGVNADNFEGGLIGKEKEFDISRCLKNWQILVFNFQKVSKRGVLGIAPTMMG